MGNGWTEEIGLKEQTAQRASNWVFNKGIKAIQWWKKSVFNAWERETGHHNKKMTIYLFFILYNKHEPDRDL